MESGRSQPLQQYHRRNRGQSSTYFLSRVNAGEAIRVEEAIVVDRLAEEFFADDESTTAARKRNFGSTESHTSLSAESSRDVEAIVVDRLAEKFANDDGSSMAARKRNTGSRQRRTSLSQGDVSKGRSKLYESYDPSYDSKCQAPSEVDNPNCSFDDTITLTVVIEGFDEIQGKCIKRHVSVNMSEVPEVSRRLMALAITV